MMPSLAAVPYDSALWLCNLISGDVTVSDIVKKNPVLPVFVIVNCPWRSRSLIVNICFDVICGFITSAEFELVSVIAGHIRTDSPGYRLEHGNRPTDIINIYQVVATIKN